MAELSFVRVTIIYTNQNIYILYAHMRISQRVVNMLMGFNVWLIMDMVKSNAVLF